MPDMIEPVVSTSPLVRQYTLDEFFALPAPENGGYYELIAGVLYMVPPPGGPHHLAASRLIRVLSRFADAWPDLCMLFVPHAPIWTASTYLEPELFLIRNERVRAMGAGHLRTADLVVEILSPGNANYDRTAKADTYAALGVTELWLVDLETRSIEQRVLQGAAYAVRGRFAGAQLMTSAAFDALQVRPDDVLAD